jgi:hypothetical protein
MSTAEAILSRLDKVRQTAANRWMARCPAHEDGSPSLSIRELPDGRTLVHCFAGCASEDILGAVSLAWKDLQPATYTGKSSGAPAWTQKFSPLDLLQIVSEEVTVVAIVASDMLAQKTISEDSWKRLASAAGRINRVRDYARPVEVHPSRTKYPNYGR